MILAETKVFFRSVDGKIEDPDGKEGYIVGDIHMNQLHDSVRARLRKEFPAHADEI